MYSWVSPITILLLVDGRGWQIFVGTPVTPNLVVKGLLDPFQEEQNFATPASEWTPNFESKAGHNSRQ